MIGAARAGVPGGQPGLVILTGRTGPGRESLIQAAEDGNHPSMAMMARIRADSRTGDDQPDLAAFSPGAPTGAEQRAESGGVAEASPRQVDHVGFPSLCGRPEQGGPEPVCVGNVDLFGVITTGEPVIFSTGNATSRTCITSAGQPGGQAPLLEDPSHPGRARSSSAFSFQITGELCPVLADLRCSRRG